MNSVRLAYCFKLQSETSYNTLIEQFGSGCAKIKIEYSDYVPEQQIDREEIDQIGIVSICHLLQLNLNSKVVTFLQDTEIIPELTTSSIELPPKIIDDIEIKIEPEEEEELLVKITDM